MRVLLSVQRFTRRDASRSFSVKLSLGQPRESPS